MAVDQLVGSMSDVDAQLAAHLAFVLKLWEHESHHLQVTADAFSPEE
jgi:hypothetical protein